MIIILLLALLPTAFAASVDYSVVENDDTEYPGNQNYLEMIYEAARRNIPEFQANAFYNYLHDAEVQDLVDKMAVTLQDNDRCNFCKFGIDVLRIISDPTWTSETAETWIAVCDMLLKLFVGRDRKTEIMCPGVMNLQGPHIHWLVVRENTTVTPEKACLTLNFCFPPPQPSQKIHSSKYRKKIPDNAETVNENKVLKSSTKQKTSLRFIHITDLHIDPNYEEGSIAEDCGVFVCCRFAYGGNGTAGAWGAYQCNIPERTLELLVDKISKLTPTPDFLLYSGDSPPHHVWDETWESQMDCTRKIVAAFQTKLLPLGIKAYSTIGNHEMYPTNLFYTDLNDTLLMMDEFTSLWKPLSNFTEEQEETNRLAGYYRIRIAEKLILLSFNSEYTYNLNFYNMVNDERQEVIDMWNFMEETFNQAKLNGDKVILLGHHGIGQSYQIVTEGRRLFDLIISHSDVILMQIAGHTHISQFSQYIDPQSGVAGVTVFVAASGTTTPGVKPSFRVWQLDRDLRGSGTWQASDFHTHFLNLTEEHDVNNPPPLVYSYSAKQEYGLTDMSAASWQQLTNRFEADEELFQRYWFHERPGTRTTYDCGADCKKQRLCAIRNAVYDRYLECVNRTAAATTTPSPTPTPSDPPVSAADQFGSSVVLFWLSWGFLVEYFLHSLNSD